MLPPSVNARCVPSGDQDGERPCVSRRIALPSGRTRKSVGVRPLCCRENAIVRPSGDQAGSRSPRPRFGLVTGDHAFVATETILIVAPPIRPKPPHPSETAIRFPSGAHVGPCELSPTGYLTSSRPLCVRGQRSMIATVSLYW